MEPGMSCKTLVFYIKNTIVKVKEIKGLSPLITKDNFDGKRNSFKLNIVDEIFTWKGDDF